MNPQKPLWICNALKEIQESRRGGKDTFEDRNKHEGQAKMEALGCGREDQCWKRPICHEFAEKWRKSWIQEGWEGKAKQRIREENLSKWRKIYDKANQKASPWNEDENTIEHRSEYEGQCADGRNNVGGCQFTMNPSRRSICHESTKKQRNLGRMGRQTTIKLEIQKGKNMPGNDTKKNFKIKKFDNTLKHRYLMML